MRARWMAVAAVLALIVPGGMARAQSQTGSGDRAGHGPALVGAWASEPDRMRVITDLEKSVWGEDAETVRTVDLQIEAGGEALLTVTRKVVDAAGEPKPASISIEAVRLRVGEARPTTAGRLEHAVDVLEAERRYPDDPEYRWPLENVRVRIVGFEADDAVIEIRYDTPEGRGSFWEKLRRGDRAGLLSRHDAPAPAR